MYGFYLLVGLLFLLCLFVGSSVLWCLFKLIWVACGSPVTCLIWCTVAFGLLDFFTSYLTLLRGNLSRSTLSSVMVLDTKFSTCKKSQKMSQWNIYAVLGGYHWYCYFLDGSWSKDQIRFTPHWTAIYRNLQTSFKLCQDSFYLWIAPRIHTDPFQSCWTMQ